MPDVGSVTLQLKVTLRDHLGKGASRKIRSQDLIPGVIYGKNKKNIHVKLNPHALKQFLIKGGGINALIQLVEEKTSSFGKKTVIVKEIVKDPLHSHYLHVDFYELDLKKTVIVKVPLHFIGKAEGITQGGIVQPILREIEVKCFPNAIPSHIEIDVTPLKIGDSIHLEDVLALLKNKDFELVFTSNETVVTVSIPKEEVKEAPKPEAAAAVAGTPGAGEPQAAQPKGAAPKGETPPKAEGHRGEPQTPAKKKEEGKK